jgi:3-deoxy-7-phosphoheptulonate synthase
MSQPSASPVLLNGDNGILAAPPLGDPGHPPPGPEIGPFQEPNTEKPNFDPLARTFASLSISSTQRLPTVREAVSAAPLSARGEQHVTTFRSEIENILRGKDRRLLVIAGPCSLHDLDAATNFAGRYSELQKEVSGSMLLVMRGMFEKPRSSVGWKGFVHQPEVSGAPDMAGAIARLRAFFGQCADRGIPMAAEALDPALQLYFIDTLSYLTIGARTTESQTHRQMASLFKLPVGLKNPTRGNLKVAVDSVQAAASPQSTVMVDPDGAPLQVVSNGNALAHVVLRGGTDGPNYGPDDIASAERELTERSRGIGFELLNAVVVDCSHGNSGGDYLRQSLVFQQCIDRLCDPEESSMRALRGLMLEANLEAGKQVLKAERPDPNISVTDACIGFDTLRSIICSAHERLMAR